jgi:hypothetical protein
MAQVTADASRIALLERMLANREAMAKLPDGGEALRCRLEALRNPPAPVAIDADRDAAQSLSSSSQPLISSMTPADRWNAHLAEGDRMKDERPDLRQALEKSFAGVLSKREIARMVQDAGSGTFASWGETQEMMEREREATRSQELERIRRLTAPPKGA